MTRPRSNTLRRARVAGGCAVLVAVSIAWAGDWEVRGRLYRPVARVEWPRIVQPTIGLPAIMRPGDAFRIRIGSDEAPAAGRCRVDLARGDLRRWLDVRRARSEGGTDHLWLIEATVPPDMPTPVIYDLTVDLGGRPLVQPNAVQVVSHFADTLTLVQITDTEINHLDPAPSRRLAAAIDEINIIAPDLVLATGDLTYDGRPEQFDILIGLLRRLSVPVFTQIGNADYHGQEAIYFGRLNAYRDYSIDVGGLHVTGLDSGTNYKRSKGAYNVALDSEGTGLADEQLAWFESDLSAVPPAAVRLAFMHFPAVSQFGNRASIHVNRRRFKQACSRHRVELVLSGHTHVDSVFDASERLCVAGGPPTGEPCYVQSATTSSRTRMPLLPYSYRIVRIADGRVVSFTYDVNGDGRPDAMRSVPVGGLDVRFDRADDGRPLRFAATLTNRLHETFAHARVVFTVKAGTGARFQIDGASLLYVLPDGDGVRVGAETSLPAQSRKRLVLRKE